MHLHQISWKSNNTFCIFLTFLCNDPATRSCQAWLVTGIMCRNIIQAPYWWSSDICIGPLEETICFLQCRTQETKAHGLFSPERLSSSGAARSRQNTSPPGAAAVMTTAAIRLLWLWFCAGNLTTWKKFASNNTSCLHSPFGLIASNGITAGIDLFHRVYAEGTTNSNIYFRDSFKTTCSCW